jgi:hypothetical protein
LPSIQIQARPAISGVRCAAVTSSSASAAAASSKLSPRQTTVFGAVSRDVGGQAQERVDALVGRQHRAAAARGAFGFAEVQVGHGRRSSDGQWSAPEGRA